jgi:hypothetical protein
MPPQTPIRIRVFDQARINQLVSNFLMTSMSPAKILLIDCDERLTPKGLYWKDDSSKPRQELSLLFNTVRDPAAEFGEPWVIGGYHSSAAFVKVSERKKETPFRACDVYRLSDVPGATYAAKLENARWLAVTDNLCSQLNEGYDAQPFLISTHLWRELWDKADRPMRVAKGHQPKPYKDFQMVCVSGDEKHLRQLTGDSSSTLTPRFKLVSLDDDQYNKAFTIMCSMDTRAKIGDLNLKRIDGVEVPVVPDDEEEEEEEEEGEAVATKKKPKKKAKGERTCTLEDMKETLRLPSGELHAFLDLVVDGAYVHQFQAWSSKNEDPISFTPSVSLIVMSFQSA